MSRPSIRETIQAGRVRLAQEEARTKSVRGGVETDERQAFVGSGIPGIKKSVPGPRQPTDIEILGHSQKSIRSLIAHAKGSGTIDISSRELTEVPPEVWNMYRVDPDKIVVDFSSSGGGWWDTVDLTRLTAADNAITFIDSRIQEFGGLVYVDFHSNCLATLPEEFAHLERVMSLNLSSNRFLEIPIILFRLKALVELNLSGNQISGPLDSSIGKLVGLESLDLSDNQLTSLPHELSHLRSLRRLNLSKNRLQNLSVQVLIHMPKLTELEIADNCLTCLFSGLAVFNTENGDKGHQVLELPSLVRIDARRSGLQRMTDVEDVVKPSILLPSIKEIFLSHNNLSSLDNLMTAMPQLRHLDIQSNRFTGIPSGVYDSSNLRHLNMSVNQMEMMPSELGSMTDLLTFNWEGNPIRNVPRSIANTESLLKLLRQRQSADAPVATTAEHLESIVVSIDSNSPILTHSEPRSPPTQQSRQDMRSLANELPSPMAELGSAVEKAVVEAPRGIPDKKLTHPSQNLSLVRKGLKDLTVKEIIAACHDPQSALLDFNAFTVFPRALQETFGMTTLTKISIHHNKISDFPFQLSFPLLTILDISDNLLESLQSDHVSNAIEAEQIGLSCFPRLVELNMTANRLTEVPPWLPRLFPSLKILIASRNKITSIDPQSFEGLQSLDLSGNEIAALPPRLGNVRSIQNLLVDGNTFRVPRRQVMEQGTEAVMEYLRSRIPTS
ncbi:hypothetical protein BGW38_001499 [Lunasporangiospora selenospora]|uniref:Leucine-rich repeat-containing protein 40 n=1 Tax=Lunasporangiospora selenospora TaxID=979761 RepID=A0A9P6FVH5_9FUNG|nr:hypothetical protein BGW38_001499 [Lunasporangiospora selenospora]